MRVGAPPGRVDPCAYRIAGNLVITDGPIYQIAPWRTGSADSPEPILEWTTPHLGEAMLIYEGEGSFYAGSQQVRCYQEGADIRIDLDGRPIAHVDLESSRISCLEGEGLDNPIVHEVLLGPALMLILARRGIWCLHAGATLVDNQVVAFCAESGLGKSTLAADAFNWMRIADDILPVYIGDGRVESRPEFPQLKLDPADQYVDPDSNSLSLGAVFRILPDAGDGRVEIFRLSAADSVVQLVRHTVSSRLFAPEMLGNHMAAMHRLVDLVPVYELSYPRDFAALDEVRDAVRAKVCAGGDSP